MVSPLWKACSEGNLENVAELLKEATPVDIEVKGESLVVPSPFFCARPRPRSAYSLDTSRHKIIPALLLSSRL